MEAERRQREDALAEPRLAAFVISLQKLKRGNAAAPPRVGGVEGASTTPADVEQMWKR